jgi:aminoglycoside phosphotransferase (APT) family kinase protein
VARDLQHIQDGLATILPGRTPITRVSPLTTGYSNETYLIEGPDLILRLPPSAGAMLDGHGVVAQARIYQALRGTTLAPPVPDVVLLCEDRAVLGDPFFIMERAAGEAVNDTQLQSWFTTASDELRERMCRDWVTVFARLARLEPLKALGPHVTAEEDMRRWHGFAAAAHCMPLVAAFDRLLAEAAPRSGPAVVVHGDTKLSNLLWHESRISAVLDWELALNGEPLGDLGYLLYFFESEFHGAARAPKLSGMIKRADVIALWSQESGRSSAGVHWHEIAQIGKICAIVAECANMFESGRSSDPKLAYSRQYLESNLGVMSAMLDAADFL